MNRVMPEDNLIDDYLIERFGHTDYLYTENGRQAINLALGAFNLQSNDIVTILTTTGNFYISGCVTAEIEKFCNWSRVISEQTKLIFVNHEFGYPFQNLQDLRAHKLPIVEDCASSFFSHDSNNTTGRVGDFVIYSFPKMFPIQIGGLLVSNRGDEMSTHQVITDERIRYIKNVLSKYIVDRDKMINQRSQNFIFLKERFEALGFKARFSQDNKSVPGVFMFRKEKLNIDLTEMKKYFYMHGIQCSVFYGEESFFIPVHQALEEPDLLYFLEVIQSFLSHELHN